MALLKQVRETTLALSLVIN